MDESKNLENFEILLKKNSAKKPSALYNTTIHSKPTIRPQDVLDSVYTQIKTIQLADGKNSKIGRSDLKVTSRFLAVNKLPVYNEVPKQSFETQCVSDTQLINVIKDAEALLDAHKGMTQEFDTDFNHTNIETNIAVKFTHDRVERDKMIETQEFETTFTQTNVDDTVSFLHDMNERDANIPCDNTDLLDEKKTKTKEFTLKNVDTVKEICGKVIDENKEVSNALKTENHTKNDSIDTVNENEDKTNYNNAMEIHDIERPLSPVLKITAKIKIREPLVVSLESFEKFETVAIPLIDSNNDFETCKHLINSQILGRELCLNTDVFDDDDNGKLSPILEKSHEITQDNVKDINITKVAELEYLDSREKRSDSLDEILFSSDEENDFIYREFQDIPLTAALETSFYDHSNVLEETMYVGFQTASNKSIQINTDSFQRAQFILSENDNINGKDLSLAELVEICDEKSLDSSDVRVQGKYNSKLEAEDSMMIVKDCDITQIKYGLNKDIEMIEPKTKVTTIRDYDDTIKKPPEKQHFIGFKTASNKKINLTDKALDLSKKVFRDIDFDEKDLVDWNNVGANDKETKVIAKENVVTDPKNEQADDIDKINDDMIIQEFENIEMSLKEKEKGEENTTVNFLGFKTASNRDIEVSDAAKSKIKDIFKDINLGEINGETKEDDVITETQKLLSKRTKNNDLIETTFIGFKTANNTNIKISAQTLAKTKNIFQDIDKEIDRTANVEVKNDKMKSLNYQHQVPISKTDFIGFKTANNKNIKISKIALLKSRKIFKDIDKENANTPEQDLIESNILGDVGRNDETDTNLTKKYNDASFCDFKKASNKAVIVSQESIAKSKELFQDLDTEVTQNSSDNRLNVVMPKDNVNVFKGFQTASKKPVISAEAMERSKRIFQDIDDSDKVGIATASNFIGFKSASNQRVEVTKGVIKPSRKDFNMKSSSFVGFKTASNKNVNVSDEALAKCRKIFDDIDDLPTEHDEIPKKQFGFQTANNEQVEISKDAIEETKYIFNDKLKTEEHTFKGFQTASNKKDEVSKEAIEKTKAIFNDLDMEIEESVPFKGFQTASKNKVEVSEDALQKSNVFFNDIETPKVDKLFKGFQTARKKKVNVSERALAKSKVIFQDIDADIRMSNNGENGDSYKNEIKLHEKNKFIFQTANKQNIDVSEDALKKSRKLFEETNNEPKSNENDLTSNKNKGLKIYATDHLDNIINTQVLNNFEEELCSEDFKATPRKNKRSGSPILSCPRAKKRKMFETPYKDENDKKTVVLPITKDIEMTCTVKVKFSESYKKNKIYKLKDLTKPCSKNIDTYITNFNLDNILNFEFDSQRNELTSTKMNIAELKTIFLSAVNINLVPEGWLDNHLKLILWKLLSYEVFSKDFVCTVQNVIDQLKYRYDKELYNTERPVLRKILERDDVPTKCMVLCVAGIYIDGVSVSSVSSSKDIELLLTDGWYFVKAVIDKMLCRLVCESRIVVGSKIITCGAELVNCDQGMAPWENTSSVRLKLSGNSTRPVPWDTRLGYTRAAILSQLSSVKVDGGKISRLRAFVTRVYPLLYVEKFEDGSTVTRSERLEHLHQMKYEAEWELMMERIYEEVQKEFIEQESQDSELSESSKRCVESGSQIAKMMKRSKDPMEFRAQLTSSQIQILQEHTSKYRERVFQAIQSRAQERLINRNVVALARSRIATEDGNRTITKGMLSIWKPNEAILEILKEGSWIEIMNTVPTAVRYSEIQITAGRQSIFRPTKNGESRHLQSLRRTCYKISDVTQNPTMTTDYNEIDTVGMIFLIEPSNREFESNRNFQNVYLADADKNILSVNFWGGIKKFGFENILDTGQIVACANLQKRAGNTRKNIPQFRVTDFSHFTKTPKNAHARDMVEELNKKLFGLDRRKFCEDCVAIKISYTAKRCLNNSENESPYRFNKGDYSFGRNQMFIDTPLGMKPSKKEDMNLNLTGLDFESTFKQDTELSPKTIQRKKKVNEKIAKLKMYGEPPPLSPISIINKSEKAKKSYKSPLASVATPLPRTSVANKLPEESPVTRDCRESSPVFSIKRKFVKSVPVKLHFANESKNDSVDHFAEEFDGSPPLSLD